MRKSVIAAIVVSLGLLILIGVLTRPVSGSVLRYFWWWSTSRVSATSGNVEAGDARIHYQTYGCGAPLVLLHGGLSSGLDWIGELPELSRRFQVILIDLRGHGRSTIGSQPFTYRLLAHDVRVVLDALGVARTDIVGWSDGGNVGLLFALEYPAAIGRLIAISANYSPAGISPTFEIPQGSDSGQSRLTVSRLLHRLRSPEPDGWSQLHRRVTSMWRAYPKLGPTDLQTIKTPTLILVGSDDHIDTAHASDMATAMPDAELVILDGVGHAIPRDAPRMVLQNIESFLKRPSGKSPGIAENGSCVDDDHSK